jgi:hypothetical protein
MKAGFTFGRYAAIVNIDKPYVKVWILEQAVLHQQARWQNGSNIL